MGWFDKIEDFADEQRVIRLRECMRMEDELKYCRNIANETKKGALAAEEEQTIAASTSSEQKKSGIWSSLFGSGSNSKSDDSSKTNERQNIGEEKKSAASSNVNKRKKKKNNAPPQECNESVASERDVWNCRALALRCGNEVLLWRRCLAEHERLSAMQKNDDSDNINNTNNDQGDSTTTFTTSIKDSTIQPPCFDQESAVNECIKRNAKALEDRLKRRAEREQNEA